MAERKIKLALLGENVKNSFSPQIHRFILEKWGHGCDYALISVEKADFPKQIETALRTYDGLNITNPYKREVLPFLSEVLGDGAAIGSVNTVVCADRTGYNTDGIGLARALELDGVEIQGKRALVLGAGGAGRSVAKLFKDRGAQTFAYRRDKRKLREFCLELGVNECLDLAKERFDIIVNATGVGTKDSVGESPIESEIFRGTSWAIELGYFPKETEFMKLAKAQGARAVNGFKMLFYQAYYADCLFLKRTPSEADADDFLIEFNKNNLL